MTKTVAEFEKIVSETEGASATVHYVKAQRIWRCRFPQHANPGRSHGERGRGVWVDHKTLEGCLRKAIEFIEKHGRPIQNPNVRTLK